MAEPSNGGAFVPTDDYTVTGVWTFTQDPVFPSSGGGPILTNPTLLGTVAGAATYTTPTLTTPIVSAGLTASGSAANDFSGSTGTFKTSTGAVTIGPGAVGITGVTTFNQSATPGFSLATGKTNTGTMTVNGKTSGSFVITTADATAQTITLAPLAQTVGAGTWNIPDLAGATVPAVGTTLTQTLTNKSLTAPTITGAATVSGDPIYSTNLKSAGVQTYAGTVTPAIITGYSWTLVAGATYLFEMNLPTTMTTNGGLTISFVLTTATLTSIQYQSYASTATDNSTAVSTTGTTTTSTTKVFDSKAAAYTYVRIWGTLVCGTGGTFQWDGCQNTSAGGGDTTTILAGSYAKMLRVS